MAQSLIEILEESRQRVNAALPGFAGSFSNIINAYNRSNFQGRIVRDASRFVAATKDAKLCGKLSSVLHDYARYPESAARIIEHSADIAETSGSPEVTKELLELLIDYRVKPELAVVMTEQVHQVLKETKEPGAAKKLISVYRQDKFKTTIRQSYESTRMVMEWIYHAARGKQYELIDVLINTVSNVKIRKRPPPKSTIPRRWTSSYVPSGSGSQPAALVRKVQKPEPDVAYDFSSVPGHHIVLAAGRDAAEHYLRLMEAYRTAVTTSEFERIGKKVTELSVHLQSQRHCKKLFEVMESVAVPDNASIFLDNLVYISRHENAILTRELLDVVHGTKEDMGMVLRVSRAFRDISQLARHDQQNLFRLLGLLNKERENPGTMREILGVAYSAAKDGNLARCINFYKQLY
jgi:hypothetical protein